METVFLALLWTVLWATCCPEEQESPVRHGEDGSPRYGLRGLLRTSDPGHPVGTADFRGRRRTARTGRPSDFTVSHKQFAPGTFVFSAGVATGGFEAFRPEVVRDGKVTFLKNAELTDSSDFLPYSREQADIKTTQGFYREVARLLNPDRWTRTRFSRTALRYSTPRRSRGSRRSGSASNT